jgi:outer membrane protein assembly factor BamB
MNLRSLLALLFLAPATPAADFIDPAPPNVRTLQQADPPAAQPTRELKFHAAPTPLSKDAVTTDWPSFLGPAHAPTSPETRLHSDLKDLPPVWEYEKGTGYAPPAIVGDRLILFHRIAREEIVDCLHPATGQRYWRHTYPSEYRDRYGYTDGPRCAPVVDAANALAFTLGAEGKLHAVDLKSGQPLWKRDLLGEFKIDQNFFGVGSSPLLEGNVLIVNLGAKGACVVGIDPKTGKILWNTPAPDDWGASYASPVPATVHGLRRVFVFAGGESRPATGGLLCIDPKTGAADFAFPWRGKRFESVNASAPLVFDDKVFISECYGQGGALLQLTLNEGKLTPTLLWETDQLATHFMTALHKDGHLYGCDGHGPANCPLVCLDAKTGDQKWRAEPDLTETVSRNNQSRQLKLNTDRCHLLHVDGRTLCLTEWGHLAYLDLTPTGCKVTSRKWLFAAGETWSPPVLSKGLLYVCQNTPDTLNNKPKRLICYDLRASR